MASKKAGIIAGLAVAGIAATGLMTSGTLAFADPSAAPSTNPRASAPADAGAQSGKTDAGKAGKGARGGEQQGQDTPVTGDEAQKVIDAVKAKNADVTITEVRKDPDGTYDALGTKADGSKVMFDVSTDLGTITQGKGGPGGPGGKGGPGRQSQDTPVTGDEAQKVINAVKAKNADVTITEVRKDPDGTYDALGTKADGTKVMFHVSTDLGTITERGQR